MPFITPSELNSAIGDYQLSAITSDPTIIEKSIRAAISESTSYLASKYDCNKIFNAVGEDRNPILLEHCKSIAVWYLMRLSNVDIIYDRAREYYKEAIEWLSKVAGVNENGRSITPDLPLLTSTSGETIIKLRAGSHTKFNNGL